MASRKATEAVVIDALIHSPPTSIVDMIAERFCAYDRITPSDDGDSVAAFMAVLQFN